MLEAAADLRAEQEAKEEGRERKEEEEEDKKTEDEMRMYVMLKKRKQETTSNPPFKHGFKQQSSIRKTARISLNTHTDMKNKKRQEKNVHKSSGFWG